MTRRHRIEFDDVVAGYGEFMILNNLSFKAKRGKITLLLGPNGAGKRTVLKTLFGLLKVRQGQHQARRARTSPAPRAKDLLDEARHRLRAAGAQPVRPADGVREPRARRHHAGHEDHARAHPRGAGAVPARQGAAAQRGVVALGRRAEAARGRPRAAAAAQGAADRRAVDRPVAAGRAGRVPPAAPAGRRRHHGADGRAEREERAEDGRRGDRARVGPPGAAQAGRRTAGRSAHRAGVWAEVQPRRSRTHDREDREKAPCPASSSSTAPT